MGINSDNIVFLNLPNNVRVQRRYMCSYNAPNMLFPPIELLYLAAIAREWHQKNVFLVDAIAENLNLESCIEKVAQINPDIIVTITGFEIFEEDIITLNSIINKVPQARFVVFGHYPTIFPEEIFKHASIDFILYGEPDVNFSNLLDYLNEKITINELVGVYYLDEEKRVKINKGEERIKKPGILPFPAHDLLKIDAYFEPFLPQPFALIQTARGCPYSCNFCVRSYGQRLSLRNPKNIIEELIWLKKIHQIKSFRIIDDTFTATSKRVIEFCNLLIENNLNLSWTCLSRADTLNEELIQRMKESGCKRVYIGFESGSKKVLQAINKDIDQSLAIHNVKLLKKYNIEVSGFFMVGHPLETEIDFEDSVKFAIDTDLDYITAFEFITYPGTAIYDEMKEQVNFSLMPYKNEFIDKNTHNVSQKRVKQFYKRFYLRPSFILTKGLYHLKKPIELMVNFYKMLLYQFSTPSKSRNDYL